MGEGHAGGGEVALGEQAALAVAAPLVVPGLAQRAVVVALAGELVEVGARDGRLVVAQGGPRLESWRHRIAAWPPPRSAFVTGGSGFIGGALIRRLVADGGTVAALAGAPPPPRPSGPAAPSRSRGDLDDVAALRGRDGGADVAFHAAAHLGDWGPGGRSSASTSRAPATSSTRPAGPGCGGSCTSAPRRRSCTASPSSPPTSATPLAFDSPVLYSATKARAEEVVLEAGHGGAGDRRRAAAVRLGRGDTTLLPVMIEMVRAGRFAWIGGGRQRTSTSHVDNVGGGPRARRHARVERRRMVRHRRPAVVFREFVTALLATQGVDAPERSVPLPLGRRAGRRGRAALAPPAAPRPSPCHALLCLGVGAGVHAERPAGPSRARLRAGRDARGGTGGAGTVGRVTELPPDFFSRPLADVDPEVAEAHRPRAGAPAADARDDRLARTSCPRPSSRPRAAS